MSYTTILKITPGKSVEDLQVLRNSYGSAPVVWDHLCQDILKLEQYNWLNMENLDRLWKKWDDFTIAEFKRALLMMTFDKAYVSRPNYLRAARDIRLWLDVFPVKENYVNHWPRIAEIYESKPDCEAIAIYHTSVSDNPFITYDDEAEIEVINWDDAFEIYEDLDSLRLNK